MNPVNKNFRKYLINNNYVKQCAQIRMGMSLIMNKLFGIALPFFKPLINLKY